jgi:hypothetical protein
MKRSQKNRKGALCLLALLTLGVVTPATLTAVVPVTQAPPVFTPVTINSGPGDQFDPHISGDWVAYTSDVGIRYYNFSTNIDAAIPMGESVNDLLSGVSGSKIVFSRVTLTNGTAVMVFDAATAAAPIEVDTALNPTRFGAAIGGNTVAYIDFGLQANGELVVSDLITKISTRITTDTVGDGNPSVSPDGNVVVWEHCLTSLTNCDIYQAVRSGGIWNTSVVSDTLSPEGNPGTNGALVVYDSHRGTNEDIFWRPVGGGAEIQLELPGFEGNPSIAGNYIVFEGRASVVDAADIFVYDILNNLLYPITNTPLVNEQLNDVTLLPDGRLRAVWSSDEDGPDQRNIKAVTFRLPTFSTATATVQPPINANGSSVFNAKRGVVPVKFTLASNGTATCQLPAATIAVTRTAGGSLGGINESDFTQPSDAGANFRVDGCQYIYNLGVSSLGAGTYLVQIKIGETAVGSATIALK